MQNFIDHLAFATKVVAGFLLGAMTIMVAIVILGRYTNLSVPWADELARIFFIWSAFLGAASGIHNKMHFSVSFLTSYFNKSTRFILAFLTSFLVVGIAVFIITVAYPALEVAKIQILPALQISRVWVHLSVISSCVLMFVFVSNQIIMDFRKIRE